MSLDDKLSRLPDRPGVYLYRDAKAQVIYVGKAASLKSRVRSYFQDSRAPDPKTDALVRQIADLEYLVGPGWREEVPTTAATEAAASAARPRGRHGARWTRTRSAALRRRRAA